MFRNLVVPPRGRVLRSAAMIFAVVAGGLVVNTQSAAAAAYDPWLCLTSLRPV
ncbi:hypothetical protein EV644_102183 [Kribbella orskensis]|uniref:Uncharacterized protein n=1 Tax=Kribbella orskensis TaxID=2512216 RepID=A0ABY2BS12_9ACTN|nr:MULTISPECIES: hypothetical protein [Kribbella]TCN43179.1 hypothetical protein EV642_102554 [Kribbella sp. VKM Ac-2500]TCO29465.1 hypothetical protein EV644_102183 [Kribbella orskensis]